jgi:hypothetical protein
MTIVLTVIVVLCVACVAMYVAGYLERVRDRAARDVLSKFDADEERKSILTLASHLAPRGYTCPLCGAVLVPTHKYHHQVLQCSQSRACPFFEVI